MALNFGDIGAILRNDYQPIIRALLTGDTEKVNAIQAQWAKERALRHGIGPLQSECMPLWMDPSNVWYWMPEEYEAECDCEC